MHVTILFSVFLLLGRVCFRLMCLLAWVHNVQYNVDVSFNLCVIFK